MGGGAGVSLTRKGGRGGGGGDVMLEEPGG